MAAKRERRTGIQKQRATYRPVSAGRRVPLTRLGYERIARLFQRAGTLCEFDTVLGLRTRTLPVPALRERILWRADPDNCGLVWLPCSIDKLRVGLRELIYREYNVGIGRRATILHIATIEVGNIVACDYRTRAWRSFVRDTLLSVMKPPVAVQVDAAHSANVVSWQIVSFRCDDPTGKARAGVAARIRLAQINAIMAIGSPEISEPVIEVPYVSPYSLFYPALMLSIFNWIF